MKNFIIDFSTWATIWKSTILVISILVNIALIFRLFFGNQSIIEYREFKEQYLAVQEKIAEQKDYNALLSNEIRLLHSDERYVEKMIRQRLNYVKENEVLYLFNK